MFLVAPPALDKCVADGGLSALGCRIVIVVDKIVLDSGELRRRARGQLVRDGNWVVLLDC